MNHTCSAVAVYRQTQPDTHSLLCPTVFAPLGPACGFTSLSSLCCSCPSPPGLGSSLGQDAPTATLGIVAGICVPWVAAAVSL